MSRLNVHSKPPPRAARAPAAREPIRARAGVLLPPELVDAVAERVLDLLQAQEQQTAWLTVPQAAEHLACSKHRLYRLVSMRAIPHEHEGARLLFDRAALDAWVRAGGAR